jgi:Protein of unknown function (DUF3306)
MADGFLTRWSRRKSGKLDEPVEAKKEVDLPAEVVSVPNQPALPAVTLEDVDKIDPLAPDFSAFMRSDVDPAVQQAALKKMFSDPHFNVMDGLDIYIDDYSKPDPLPAGMLQRMAQSEMLKLFNRPNDDGASAKPQESNLKTDNPLIEATQPSSVSTSDVSFAEKIPSVDNALEPINQKKQSSENSQ